MCYIMPAEYIFTPFTTAKSRFLLTFTLHSAKATAYETP